MEKKREGVFLVLFGLVIIPLLFELILCAAGSVYYSYRIKHNHQFPEDKDKTRILCLGDSFTFGIGAIKGNSYPEQLEKILNKNNSGKKFVVYNAATPGYNSSQLSRHFDEFIQRFNPDIVIVTIGINNKNIPLESNYFLFSNNGFKNQMYKTDYFLSRVRSYKLLKFVIGKLIQSTQRKNIKMGREDYLAEGSGGVSSEEFEEFIKLGNAYFDRREATLAKKAFQNAITLNPNDERGHLGLAKVLIHCIGESKSAIEELNKASRINPHNPEIFDSLWMANYRLGRNEEARGAIARYLSNNPLDEDSGMRLSHILSRGLPDINDEESFNKLLRFDLENIVKLGKKNNVKIILQNYPLSKENKIIRYVAESLKVPLVDNESVFEKLILYNGSEIDWRNNKEYFAEDGHCNANGYRIMAENAYEVISPEVGKLQ